MKSVSPAAPAPAPVPVPNKPPNQPPKKPKRSADELAFLPAALEIVETPPSPLGRSIGGTIILLFVLALCGGLVLLTLRISNREQRSPPPMMGVSLHAVMALSALLLLVLGYTHR